MNPRLPLGQSLLGRVLLAGLALAPAAHAAVIDFSATAGSGNNWTNGANWLGGAAPANDLTTDIARFNQTSYVNQPSVSTTARSVGGIVVGDGLTATAAVTISGTSLTLGSSGIDVKAASGAVTFSTTTLSLGANQVWNNSSSNLLTVGNVDGAFSIEKTGSGTIILTGGAYSGGFTLTAGNLRLNGNSAAGTGTLALNGGILSTSGSSARTLTNSVTIGGDVQLGATGISGLATLSGPIAVNGNRQLTFVNTGVVLSGAMTLNGNLTLNSEIGTPGTVPTGSNITSAIADGLGSHGIVKSGTGVATLSGANTYSGGTTINDGVLNVGSTSALGTGTVTFAGGQLDLRGQNLIVNALSGSSGSITDTAAAGTRTLTVGQGGGNGVFTGNFTQSIGTKIIAVTKTGSGTQIFGGVNGYTGKTTVAQGTLQFAKQVSLYNNTTASWTAANIQVDSGATLAFNVGGAGEFTETNINSLLGISTSTGGFKNGSILGIDTTNASGGLFTFNSSIADTNGGANSLGLAKLGSGTLVFIETLSFTGDVFIRGGTLSFQNASIADTASVSISTGAVFNLDFFGTDTVSSLSLAGLGTDAGTYGRIGSGAQFESAFFTGDGLLNVTVGTSAVPEPSAFAFIGGVFALLVAAVRRRHA